MYVYMLMCKLKCEVPPCLLRCFGLSDIVEHVINNTRCKTIHHLTRRLFLG